MTTAPARPPMDRRLLIALLIVGALIVLALIVVIVVLLTRGTAGPSLAGSTTTPTAGSTASVSASASPTPAASSGSSGGGGGSGGGQATTAPDTSTHFTSFTVVTTVHCAATEAGNAPKPVVTLSWASQNATEAWFSPANVDAKDQAYMQVPTTGNQNDLTDEHLFDCGHRQTEDVTITLVGANGVHVSKHATITDADWQN